jgi:NHL repeat-containing protein
MTSRMVLIGIATLAGAALFASLAYPAADELPPVGTIITVAGSGPNEPENAGFGGDGAPATEARLGFPWGVTLDAAGNFYIADGANHRVRKVGGDGTITTVAGSGPVGAVQVSFAGEGGPATQARMEDVAGVAIDGAGNVYIASPPGNRILKVSPDGILTTVAGDGKAGSGGDGGPATQARLNWPLLLAVDASESLYFSDFLNHRVRKISPDGTITTVAGNGKPGFSGDGGPATQARLSFPAGLAVDAKGNLFIVTDGRVRKVGPDGIIATVAGTGVEGLSGDAGPATQARLNTPVGLAADSGGNLFIADHRNQRVRKVDSNGIITTVAGSGPTGRLMGGFGGDGGPATQARMQQLETVAVDAVGNLLVADTGNHRVRKVFGVAAPGLLAGRPFPQP